VEANQQLQPKNPDVVELLQTELAWLVVDKIFTTAYNPYCFVLVNFALPV
jgi:hypothetical protein